ncbi:hypothetical protein ACHAWF_006684, partial [Thalassiosira exigua]
RKRDDSNGSSTSGSGSSNGGESTKPQFIVVHGAGSFGHHSAKRYGLRCGKAAYLEDADHPMHPDNNSAKRRKLDASSHEAEGANANEINATSSEDAIKQRYQMEGVSKTRHSVQKLNAATVACLIKHGVNAVGISPGISVHGLRAHGATGLPEATSPSERMHDDSPAGMKYLCQSIEQALQVGLVPVVHGDACLLYDGLRGGILGGDTIAEGICRLWDCEKKASKISQVIFITDVAGVCDADPKMNKGAKLIRWLKVDKETGELKIERKKANENGKECNAVNITNNALDVGGSSHAHDVTGGLKAKLSAAISIVQNGIDVIITQCSSGATEQFVKGNWDFIWAVEAGTLLSLSST